MPIQKNNVVTSWERMTNAFLSPLYAFTGQALWPAPLRPTAERKNVPPSEHDVVVDSARLVNRSLDEIFYNVAVDDIQKIAEFKGMQGSIVYVEPVADGSYVVVQYGDAYGLLEQKEIRNKIEAIAVAGVGSSALGAAALARDVAAAIKKPVAAVVSGCGVDDLLFQGLGGAWNLREDNQLEFWFERMLKCLPGASFMPFLVPWLEDWDSIGCGPDVVTLKSLLRPGRSPEEPPRLPNLKWVVGHSKGNLVISSAISELIMEDVLKTSELANVNFVLFSALTALPPIGKQFQIIGALDGFGLMNSRLLPPYKIVPGAWHHLNRGLPFYLNAVQELSELAAAQGEAVRA
jgi:hypothetical protein